MNGTRNDANDSSETWPDNMAAPDATVHETATVGTGARISAKAVIGPRAEVGAHARIRAEAVIGADAEIGASTLSAKVRIGKGARSVRTCA